MNAFWYDADRFGTYPWRNWKISKHTHIVTKATRHETRLCELYRLTRLLLKDSVSGRLCVSYRLTCMLLKASMSGYRYPGVSSITDSFVENRSVVCWDASKLLPAGPSVKGKAVVFKWSVVFWEISKLLPTGLSVTCKWKAAVFSTVVWLYMLLLRLQSSPTGRGSSIGSVFAWHASGPEFDPHVRHILSLGLGHENISTAIFPLPLIQVWNDLTIKHAMKTQ